MLCGIVLIPMAISYVLIKPLITLQDEKFRRNWGVLYDTYKFQDRLKIKYRLLFCIRRILFVGSIVVFDTVPIYQLILLLLTNLLMTHFIGYKPFKSLVLNRIEIMNEYLMSSICYSSIVMTDYLTTNEDKYRGAWFTIGLISVTLCINISIVLWFLLVSIKQVVKKYFNRGYRWLWETVNMEK